MKIIQQKPSSRTLLIFLLLSALVVLVANQTNFGMFNKFKKGFYFEKYKTTQEAKAALLELHPVGSDVKKAINTLKKAGCKCKSLDQNQLEIAKKNNLKIKHLTKVVHCEASTGLMNSVVWRVGLMLEMDKIYDIGIGKEYLGL